ncbi:MAG: dynamin family protein [Humibacillus sp.]|nr:dynamin family protein [Humibacillus sp.]MDN5775910.1 dynamin family protein [Humibacillus sp.]
MDPLKDYQHSRLALADAVREVVHVARERQDDLVEQECRRLLAKLAEDRFTLAVVGQFSRGKSTLMNAILGGAYLPTGVLPMTSVITTVRYGSRLRATYQRRGHGLPITVPLAEVSNLITQNSVARTQLQVTDVTIELPVELLRLGFAFVDTPGIGSQIGVNTATTRQFLREADAVVFVTGFDSALTEAEMSILAEVGHSGNPLYLVINKRDLVSVESRNEVMEFVSQAVRHVAPTPASRVFGLSALQALKAHESTDTALLATSGLPEFESSLTTFLAAQKSSQFLRSCTTQALAIIRRQRRDLSISSRAGVDRTVVAEAFDARMSDVRARQCELVSEMRRRLESALPTRLASQSERWQAELRSQLNPLLSQAQAPQTRDRFADIDVLPMLEKATLPAVREWLGQRAAEATELAIGLVSGQIGQLLDLAGSPRALGAEIAGMPLGEDLLAKGGWSAESLPLLAVPGVSWALTSETRGWAHLRTASRLAELRSRLPNIVDHAISSITDRASADFIRLTTDWVDRLALVVADRTHTAELRFTHNLGTPGSAEHLRVLDELTTRLAGSLPDLQLHEPLDSPELEGASGPVALSEPRPSAGGAGRGVEPCVACSQQEQTLIDYLRYAQFRLATREQDQRLHAQSRGFCALHTWQYYEMASPLGVSAGYAMLAESTAAALSTAASEKSQGERSISELAEAVATLATPHDGCPVCHALAEAENAEARRIAKTVWPSGDEFPPLCLHHLALALKAGPRAADGRAMVRSLAARLRRDSEDMRSYALKREAFDQGLLTDEEALAHLASLQLLVGAPSLATSQAGRSGSLDFPEPT